VERRIFARIAVTPRGDRSPYGGHSKRRSWAIQFLAAATLVALAVVVAVLIREARLNREPQPSHVLLKAPEGITVGPDGSVYVSDYEGGRVFRLQPGRGLTVVAGTGKSGEVGDQGRADKATLSQPTGLVVDQEGNLFVAEMEGHRIRRIDSQGIITTIAGNGVRSLSGDGGPAKDAGVYFPLGLAFDSKGSLYISDGAGAVRRIYGNGTISSLDLSSLPSPIWHPSYLAFNSAGDLYFSEQWFSGVGCRIARISQLGSLKVVVGNGNCGFAGDGGPAADALLDHPAGLAFDSEGNLYVADSSNNRIRRIDRNGIITTVAGTGIAGSSGDGGLGKQAQLNKPFGIAIGPGDILYIAEGGGHRVRLLQLSTGIITTAAG
jgi:sugar lactone lactonase YvrE